MLAPTLQGKWESFEKCDQNGEIHVLAGSLKLFLRELPHPLLPHQLHKDLRMAAEGSGKMKDDIPASMRVISLHPQSSIYSYRARTLLCS